MTTTISESPTNPSKDRIPDVNKITPGQKKAIVLAIFSCFAIGFLIIYTLTPALTKQEHKVLTHIPSTVTEVRTLHKVLLHILEKHTFYVYFLFCYVYTLLGSFGLPGAGPLGMLGGILFGGIKAFTICCLSSTVGGCFCYWITDVLGRGLLLKIFPNKIKSFQERLNKNKGNLFWFMLFVRISPFIPKWLINLTSSIVGMPFKTYAIGTFLGYIPATIVIVRMGLALYEIDKLGMNTESFVTLLILAFLALIPVKLRKNIEKRIE